MKVNQTMHIWPRLNPVRLPLVGKCLSMNSATRSLSSSATKTGISSTRSCTAVIFGFIPQAYITSQNRDLIHANVELQGKGKNCRPVLLLIDEAGRTEILSLADHATTDVGRWTRRCIAIPGLCQSDP